jgi:peptidyl-tRNA hydrolase, PTH1 family
VLVALGLGNPEDQYGGTRHNVGKEVVAGLALKLGLKLRPGKGDYCYAEDASRDLALVVPTTFVNLSGRPAVQALARLKAGRENLLVVCDDFSLPLGSLRLRPQGSYGGHNGLASIIYELGSDAFARLRIGIGPLPEGCVARDFVLGRFDEREQAVVDEVQETACQALVVAAERGLARAMNQFNKRQPIAPDGAGSSQGEP